MLTDLRQRFDEVLGQLESVAGWKTARVQRPVQILGSLDGIETGVRQLIRQEPLETQQIKHGDVSITVPTDAEMLRIKAVLILKRNATRDYLDFVALQNRLGEQATIEAMKSFDRLYPQPNGASALQPWRPVALRQLILLPVASSRRLLLGESLLLPGLRTDLWSQLFPCQTSLESERPAVTFVLRQRLTLVTN